MTPRSAPTRPIASSIPLPPLAEATKAALEPIVPDAATIGNPLDYTAMIWGDVERVADIVRTTASDPSVGQVLVYYDMPQKMGAAATYSWNSQLDGIVLGGQDSAAPVIVASTLPDLLPENLVDKCLQRGVPAVWGLTTGIKVADAMRRPFGDPSRLRAIGAVAGAREDGEWLAEHEAKQLLAKVGVAVPSGGVATTPEALGALVAELDSPMALKLSAPSLQHKSDVGALELGVRGGGRRTRCLRPAPLDRGPRTHARARRADGAARRRAADRRATRLRRPGVGRRLSAASGWRPWATPRSSRCRPTPRRVEAALRSLRGASLLTGGRGRPGVDLAAVADLAVRVGQLLLDEDLMLVELNPVFARPVERPSDLAGAVAVDAVIRRAV